MSLRFLLASFATVSIVAYLHIVFGLGRQFYWHVWWWDIPMHILGGVAVGFGGAWLASVFGYRPSFSMCVGAALAVGGAWEVWEFSQHLGGSAFMSYPLDTAKDILDDCLGGVFSVYLAKVLARR